MKKKYYLHNNHHFLLIHQDKMYSINLIKLLYQIIMKDLKQIKNEQLSNHCYLFVIYNI